MLEKLKLMTIIGTRPEIIRLSATIKKCDQYFDQILVHTGQNYDYTLNQVFFEDLERMLRRILRSFAAQGRQRLMVAFGCTGGRHRSVAAAEEMSRRFSRESGCSVRCFHRDIGREAEEIKERFSH